MSFAAIGAAIAGSANLLATRQATTVYINDDGYLHRGSAASPKFSEVESNTHLLIDNDSGFTWMRKPWRCIPGSSGATTSTRNAYLSDVASDKTNTTYWQSIPLWSGSNSYNLGDFVCHNEGVYKYINSGANPPPSSNPLYWQSYVQYTNSQFLKGRTYNAGAVVYVAGSENYLCILQRTVPFVTSYTAGQIVKHDPTTQYWPSWAENTNPQSNDI